MPYVKRKIKTIPNMANRFYGDYKLNTSITYLLLYVFQVLGVGLRSLIETSKVLYWYSDIL
jgi:hypothetical protein